jgi:hypothetical protein
MPIGEFRIVQENNMPFNLIHNVKKPLFLPGFFRERDFSFK